MPKDLIHSASSWPFVGGVDRSPDAAPELSSDFLVAFEAKYYLPSVFVIDPVGRGPKRIPERGA